MGEPGETPGIAGVDKAICGGWYCGSILFKLGANSGVKYDGNVYLGTLFKGLVLYLYSTTPFMA